MWRYRTVHEAGPYQSSRPQASLCSRLTATPKSGVRSCGRLLVWRSWRTILWRSAGFSGVLVVECALVPVVRRRRPVPHHLPPWLAGSCSVPSAWRSFQPLLFSQCNPARSACLLIDGWWGDFVFKMPSSAVALAGSRSRRLQT